MADGRQDIEELVESKSNPFLSVPFKLWTVGLVLFLVLFHFYSRLLYPQAEIIPDDLFLVILLALAAYLWLQETRDRRRLQTLNKSLVAIKQELEHSQVDTISVLILTEEAKDPYMCGHSGRVAEFSLAIAQEMGFPDERQKVIQRAGKLHDLGKLGISDAILNKPGKLDEQEWEVIRKHPQRAIDILKPLDFLTEEKKIILYHHERVDGRGYPSGLRGEDIPVESRIMAVADSFDAMNSERPYRAPLSRDAIMLELKRVSGTQLDPVAVSIFLTLLDRNSHFWERERVQKSPADSMAQ